MLEAPETSHSLRWRLLHLTGIVLTLAALYFVLSRLWDQRDILFMWRPSWSLVAALIAASALQGAAGFLLSGGWTRLLAGCSGSNPDRKACHRLYGRTQLAKYIPGNIFHFLGRHVLGRMENHAHRDLFCALAAENVLLLAAAGLTALPALYWMASSWAIPSRSISLTVAVISVAGALALAWHFSARLNDLWSALTGLRGVHCPRILGPVLLVYVAFFCVTGVLLVWLIWILAGWPGSMQAVLLIGVSALSWLAGFIVPGAPAGLGVREAALLVLLPGIVTESTGLLTVLLFRLVTMAGDLWFFLFAVCLGPAPGSTDAQLKTDQ